MKKTLAVILSLLMIFSVSPVAVFAAEAPVYDRATVAAGEGIDDLSSEQMAAVILDWVDRRIKEVTADFESFEVEVMGQTIAVEIPEINGVDDLVAYADYLAQLGGDFANLDVTNLKTLTRENGNLEFIYGVIQFMADNADVFGKVFHWEEGKVFDYGKVGEYILALDATVEENKQIIDFYNNYLIGNDIQEKFIAEIAKEMGYTIPVDENGERAETFDETISNGIVTWFAGLCETAGILSEEGLAALKAYDLRTTDIYTLVKNFVALVQSDNQVAIDTYYNYLLDTVVRTLLKTALGFTAEVGAAVEDAAVVEAFNAVYADLALLEEISGGKVNFKNGDAYYQVTVADGAVAAVNALTWNNTLKVNLEPPVVGVYTGGTAVEIGGYNCDLVQNYTPNLDYTMTIYTAYADEIKEQLGEVPEGMTLELTSEAIPEDITAVMTEENAKAMKELFAVKVDLGDKNLLSQVITFNEIAETAEAAAVVAANKYAEGLVGTELPFVGAITAVNVKDVSIDLAYNGYATTDEFICQVTSAASVSIEAVTANATIPLDNFDVSSFINNPVATIVLDNLSGFASTEIEVSLPDFIDTDFDIDADLLDIAGNYDAYDGAVGQVNHILYGFVDMLVSDAAMAELDLTDGDNTNLTANLEKICNTVNDMMAYAEEVMNNAGLQDIINEVGLGDALAQLNGIKADLLYAFDFSSVEGLYTSAINMILDILDNGSNELVAELNNATEGAKTLDAIAVAATDVILAKCIPAVNEAVAGLGLELTVPAKTTAAVADGAAKDIIMTKLVDVTYEAAVWAFDFLNDTANDLIKEVLGEPSFGLPVVNFELGVEKGATWEDTLAALVNRVYALADGIIIACDNEYTNTFDKISAVANAMLPLGSLASNCASDNFAFDINLVLDYMFDDALNGNFDGFLGLFETNVKTDDVAVDVPVTKALINASEHIVDAIFPDTVNAEDYEATITVSEDFTSGDNDVVIAANNMRSINARKADLVPAALNLIREAGLIPYFAACDHAAGTETVPGYDASCEAAGKEDAEVCVECGATVSGGEEIAKLDCTFGEWVVVTEAGCETEGLKRRECTVCDNYEEEAIPANGHADADGDEICDGCGTDLSTPEEPAPEEPAPEEPTFFEKIVQFFQRIIDWIMSLFS